MPNKQSPLTRRLGALFPLLFAGTALISAQSSQPNALSLEAALARAMASNPAIAAARLAGPVALAGRGVALERPHPELSYEAERETPRQSVSLSLPLELGGKRQRRIDLAEAQTASTEAELAKVIAEVRAQVRGAYFVLVAARARAAGAAEARTLATRARDAAQTRLAAGDVPRQDVVQIELALRQAENDLTAANGEASAALVELNALLGQPIGSATTPSDDLFAGTVPSLDTAQSAATRANSELAALDRKIQEQIARLNLAKAMQAPDASIGGAVTYDAQPEFSTGWRASVAVTLPVFTKHQAGVRVEDAELARLRTEREARAAAIAGAVAAARERAAAAREQVTRFQSDILPLTADVDRMAQDSYSAGQTGLPALLTALQQTRDVRRQGIEAGLEFQRALTELERAIGAPVR